MSNRAFDLLTPIVVAVVGIATGIAIFLPALKEEAEAKHLSPSPSPSSSSPSSSSSSSSIPTTTSTGTPTNTAPPPPPPPPPPSSSQSPQLRRFEGKVANAGGATTIPAAAPRWAEVQEGQFAVMSEGFRWADVPLGRYS